MSNHRDDLPVALVLGAAVWASGPSPTLRRRALHGATLWGAGAVRAVIGCGGVGRHGPAEGAVIRDLCLEAGVPDAALMVEDRSTSTEENIRFALPLLALLGTREVVIVTDGYHAPRARLMARRLGLTVTTESPRTRWNRRRAKAALREVPAYLWYAVRVRR